MSSIVGGVGGAILGAGIIGGVGSIASGYMGSKAAKSAAQTSADASNAASQVQWDMYQQQREDTMPWIEAGMQALDKLENYQDFDAPMQDLAFDYSSVDLFRDPSYTFRLDEGVNALDRSAASRGRLLSGAQDKAVTRYGQDLASQEYNNAFARALNKYNTDIARDNTNYARQRDEYGINLGREQSLAGVGQTANNMMSSAGQQTAGNVGNIMMNSASQQGNAIMQGGNAMANAYGGLAQAGNQGISNYLYASAKGLL